MPDAWVLGFDEKVARRGKYETIEQENTRVWLAFRPTGSSVLRLPSLPTGGLPTESALIAGNRSGATIFAWSTDRGTFVAWGDEAGKISAPQFFGHGLQVVSAGVDRGGRALIVGYYPGYQFSETARAIVTLAGRAGGALSLHELVAASRRPRQHLQGYLGEPVAAVGFNGDALVIWETHWVKQNYENEFAGPTLAVHRRLDGRFDKPVHLAKAFFDDSTVWHGAAVDATGAAVVLRPQPPGYRVTTLTPGGRVKSERRLWPSGGPIWPSFAANAQGQAVIGWVGPCRSCISTVAATTNGTISAVQTLAVANEVPEAAVSMAVDGQGTDTAVWMERTSAGEGYVVNAGAIAPLAQIVPVARLPGP